MMLTHTVRLAITALALAAGLVVAAHADAGPGCQHGKHAGFGSRFERMDQRVDALGLDDATRQKVHAILADAREQRRANWEQLRASRQTMHDLLARPDVTEAQVMAQVDADAALHTEAHKAQLRTMLAIRSLLTPEQWEAFRARPDRGDAKTAS
jgi:periplasmic protein CpxP/Spy